MTDVANPPSSETPSTAPTHIPTPKSAGDGGAPPVEEGVKTPEGTPESVESDKKVPASLLSEEPKETEKEPDPEGAPEGELKIELPEGVTVDKDTMTAYTEIAKELKLDSKTASQLAQWQIQHQQAVQERLNEAWVKEIEKDPDFGGQNLEQSVVDARKFLRRYGGPETVKVLTAAGMGNFPELFKLFARAGRGLKEDSGRVTGGTPKDKGAPMTREEKLRQNIYKNSR